MLYRCLPLTGSSWADGLCLSHQTGPPEGTHISATSPNLRSPQMHRPGWLTLSAHGQAHPGGSPQLHSLPLRSGVHRNGFLVRKCTLCYGNRQPRPRPSDRPQHRLRRDSRQQPHRIIILPLSELCELCTWHLKHMDIGPVSWLRSWPF